MAGPVKPKKHLGQHFLTDKGIAQKIVQSLLEKDKQTLVMEVGPGTGVLTSQLVALDVPFLALDVDEESVDYLKTHHPDKRERFLLSDFLETDLHNLAKGRFNVLGNFPYNISSQIMFRVLEYRNDINLVVGMFQKEVAQRIATPPGSKAYGILSVLLQAWYDIEYLFTVNENVFNPPPKVKSAVIRLTRNKTQSLACDEVLFKNVVKTTFNQRRKTIRNSIKPILQGRILQSPLAEKRPEQLSVQQFVELTQTVQALLNSDAG